MVIRRQAYLVILVASIVLLSFPSTAEEKYYKVVRADGSIEYTREKPSKGSKPIELPGLSVISPEKDADLPQNSVRSDQGVVVKEPARKYGSIGIASPSEQENLWGTAGTITVRVELSKKLNQGDKIQLSLDGEDFPAIANTTFTLNDVYRGEHKLVAKVVSSKGKVLATSPTRTFYIMMANVR